MPLTIKGTIPFRGKLFDGDHRLAEVVPGRFVSFNFPAGDHVFSAGLRQLDDKTALHLTVKDGERYCIRLTEKYTNTILTPVSFTEGFLDEVDCQRAAKEAQDAKPIESKHVPNAVRASLSSSNS